MDANKKPLEVCIIINELLRGGAQKIVADLAHAFSKQDVVLTVLTLRPSASYPDGHASYDALVRSAGVQIHSVSTNAHFGVWGFFRLVRLLRRLQPDVVHTWLPVAGIVGRLAARCAGVPVIISTQCNSRVAYSTIWYWLDRITLRIADAWTAPTTQIEREYGGETRTIAETSSPRAQHWMIPAGVHFPVVARSSDARAVLRGQFGIPPEATLAIMTARFISWKGHMDVIDAWQFVSNSAHLCLIGWGELETALRERARARGVADRVHFLTEGVEAISVLGMGDLYVQIFSPAENGFVWSGPTLSLLEAIAAGLPCVVSDIGGMDTLLVHRHSGLRASVGDIHAIADEVNWLISHRQEGERMVQEAQSLLRAQYSIAAMAAQYLWVYRRYHARLS